jgi:non-heme chloroperoxidase
LSLQIVPRRVDQRGAARRSAKVNEGVIQNWWRQGVLGGIKAHYDGIVAFSRTAERHLLKNGILKIYQGFPHGMCTTQADTINADLLQFIKS